MISERYRAALIIFFWAMVGTGIIDAMSDWLLMIFIPLVISFLVVRSLRKHGERLRESRRRHRLCAWCCYDLRGIASIRCPECGTMIEAAAKSGDPFHATHIQQLH